MGIPKTRTVRLKKSLLCYIRNTGSNFAFNRKPITKLRKIAHRFDGYVGMSDLNSNTLIGGISWFNGNGAREDIVFNIEMDFTNSDFNFNIINHPVHMNNPSKILQVLGLLMTEISPKLHDRMIDKSPPSKKKYSGPIKKANYPLLMAKKRVGGDVSKCEFGTINSGFGDDFIEQAKLLNVIYRTGN